MLTRILKWAAAVGEGPQPWTVNVGVARTLIALSGFGTLLLSSLSTLMQPGTGTEAPYCQGASGLSLWCLAPAAGTEWARVAVLAVLFVAASGWRPRFTALPLWWILFSDQASFTLVDGGDQIAAVLALLLIPISLTDSRKWHWMRSSQQFGRPRKLAVTVARVSRGVICVQVAFIYLDACLSKLSVPEWVDGTAGYYWLQDPMFGPAGVLRTISNTLMLNPLLVTAMTWGTLVIEFSLGVALLLSARHRAILFPIGLLFHLGIALTMGLWSFVFVMWAALALYLRAEGDFPAEWLSAFRRSRSRSREARRCSVARG